MLAITGFGGNLDRVRLRDSRNAMLSIKGLKGVEGTYNFEPNGDGVHGYNVVRNEKGKIAFIKHIEFDQ